MLILSALFAASALLAFATIVSEVRNRIGQIGALRAELANCPATRELRFTVREHGAGRQTAKVLVLPVRPREARAVPFRQAGLRAAA